MDQQNAVKVVMVTLTHYRDGKESFESTDQASSWKEASVILRRMAEMAPVSGYDKVDYHIRFSNGCTLQGVYRLRSHDVIYGDLYRRVKNYCEFYAGKRRPSHISKDRYRRVTEMHQETHLNYLETTIYPSAEE